MPFSHHTLCVNTQDQTTELLHGVPLKQTRGGKKRNVVSVADPTDILTNLHLARYPLEQSSELTQDLGPDDVQRLNQKRQEDVQYRPPPDRLKLFSFSKRHLRLPFSRGKGKREKRVKLAPTPPVEKTSPKRRGSKSDARNRRLSRNQPGKRQFFPFSGKRVVLGAVELFALPLPCYLVEFLIQFHWLKGNVKKQNSSKRNYGLGGGDGFPSHSIGSHSIHICIVCFKPLVFYSHTP